MRLAGRKLISEIASVPRIEDERDDILAKKARRLQAIGVAPDDDRIDEIEAILNVGEIQPVIPEIGPPLHFVSDDTHALYVPPKSNERERLRGRLCWFCRS